MFREAKMYYVLSVMVLISAVCAAQRKPESAIRQFYKNQVRGSVRFAASGDSLVPQYQDLQQIVLIRHGQPDLTRHGCMNRKDFSDYIKAYDTVGVRPAENLPFAGDTSLKCVYTSRLMRAMHSARLIFGSEMTYIADRRFNEFERRAMSFPNIKMPFGFWSGAGRILWLLGGNDNGIESFSEARFRAYYNALFLEDEADQRDKALLVAHGFMNRYIVKYLRRRGWKIIDLKGKSYFGCYVAYRIL